MAAKKPLPADARAGADALVTAVSSSTGQGAVELKFNLKQHPQVGQSADLELVLTPNVNLHRLYATFQVSEGLELRSGGEIAGKEKLAARESLSHLVTFVPKRDGIFYVSAVVVSDAQDTSTSRAYSIPVIAGAGLAPAAPAPQTTTSVVTASIPESTAN
jgi:hypothetical protein